MALKQELADLQKLLDEQDEMKIKKKIGIKERGIFLKRNPILDVFESDLSCDLCSEIENME